MNIPTNNTNSHQQSTDNQVNEDNSSYNSSYNFAPTQIAPIYTNHHLVSYNSWGLTTSYLDSRTSYRTFNARKEKVKSHHSPLWNAVLQYRCVVPITGYYEWLTDPKVPKKKTPYYVTREDPNELMFLLGFYNHYESTTKQGKESKGTFTILTRPSEGKLTWLHARIPMMIKPHSKEWNDWLNPDLKFDDKFLEFDNYEDGIKWYEVSSLVGNVRNNGEELTKEVKKERGINQWLGNHDDGSLKYVKEEDNSTQEKKDSSDDNEPTFKKSIVKSEPISFRVKKETHHRISNDSKKRSITDMLTSKQIKKEG